MDDSLFDVADVHNVAGDGQSLLEKAGDWVSKGIPVAAASGVISVLNTGISFGNLFGDYEKIDTESKIRDYDDDLATYYNQHKEGADLGGFVATSLIPGTLGIKGLKALQAIKGGGAIGEATANITGYAASIERKAIEKAAETVAGPTNLIWSELTGQKLKAIAAGVGDQALQGLAFEAGVLLTMNQNPVINSDDRNYFGSILHNIPQSLENAAVFGGVGGLFEAAKITGAIKSLKQNKDRELFPFKNQEGTIGLNAMDPGTELSYMWYWHNNYKTQYDALLQEATIDDRALNAFKRNKVDASRTAIDKYVTDNFVNKDSELSELIRKSMDDLKPTMEDGYKISESEKFARAFGGAEKVRRLGNGELEEGQRVVKLSGDEIGDIKGSAYAAPGDLGKLEIRNEKIYIDGDHKTVDLNYNPSENTPTDSSLQFMQARISKPLKINEEIPVDNLPLLEKAYLQRDSRITFDSDGVKLQLEGSEISSLLREQKQIALQNLINQGKDLDYISRALNVPKEFLNNPQTGRLSLAEIEDHTKPLYTKITYGAVDSMAKFQQEGMLAVYESRKVAKSLLDNAAASTLGEDIQYFAHSGPLVNVTTMPEMAGLFKAVDPAYGSTGSKFTQDGKMVSQITQKWAVARSDLLHGSQQAIIQDAKTLAEMNTVVAKMRAGSSDWVKLPDDIYHSESGEFILIQRDALNAVLKDKKTPIDTLHALTNGVAKDSEQIIKLSGDSPIAEYMEKLQGINSERAIKRNTLNAAKGSTRVIPSDAYYIPPIDTTRQPHFVMVRQNNPLASGENPVTFIVAPSAEALERKVGKIKDLHGDTLQILTPKDIQDKKIIDGVYESGDFFQKSAVDSEMKRMGLLTDFVPRTDSYVFTEFDNYLYRQESSLVRQSVESIRSDEFAQLRTMADGYGEFYSAKFGGKSLNPADNPYLQLINTALNVSNKGHYDEYWGAANRGVSAAWNTATTIASKLWGKAERGELTVEEANRITASHGWRTPYGDVLGEIWNPIIKDPNSLSKLVGKANLAIATLMLRMDSLNAVINTISLPILMQSELTSIKRNLSDPAIVGKLNNLLSEQVPGSSHRIPSAAKLLFDGTGNYIKNPEVGIPGINQNMHEYFTSIGAIKTDPQLLRAAMDAVPLTQDLIKSEGGIFSYVSNLSKRVGELGAKYSGNNMAEDFVRFQAAHAMLQVAKEAGITSPAELASYINTYVNRVHGNYLASQRPALFQGPIGQAIGLFQTYQFNMIQQMTRYLQQGDSVAVKTGLALQNSIFGLQGNPLFYQLNSYIGNSNRENQDIVSTVDAIAGSPSSGVANPARWLMYGLGANALQVNLYSRGDLTPRYATIVPDRIQDIPAISIPAKTIGSFLDSMNMINKGAGVKESILNGISHSGFNRPLAGLASLAQGARTTSQGSLLNAYNDIDGWLVGATLAGGRPLNEAVLVDQYYRMQSYESADRKKLKEVAEAVKLTASGQRGILNPDQTQNFLSEYVQAGGNQSRANSALIKWSHDSQESVVNRMKRNYNSPFGKRMRDMMGNADSIENVNTSLSE